MTGVTSKPTVTSCASYLVKRNSRSACAASGEGLAQTSKVAQLCREYIPYSNNCHVCYQFSLHAEGGGGGSTRIASLLYSS